MIASNGVNTYSGVYVTESTSVVKTISCYVKKGSKRWVFLLGYSGNSNCWFDLDNAVVGTMGADYSASSITSVGNGWYRIDAVMNSATGGSNNIGLYGADADNSNTCTGDGTTVTAYIWGYQANIGATAKPYFPTTDRLNVPRLTYQNGGGGCPSLLLEKQSTNTITYSEDITNSLTSQVNTTVTANNTTSPDGTQNADLVAFTGANAYRLRNQTVAASTTYTMSLFVKNNNFASSEILYFNMSDGVVGGLTADINVFAQTATFSGTAGAYTGVSGKVESYGNGWFRVSVSGTSVNGGGGWYEIATAGITRSCYVWGLSLEISSYPTSYIPTTSASATRVADACFKTGISSLIGQTEGVVFCDFINVPNLSFSDVLSIGAIATGLVELQTSGGSTINAVYYNGGTLANIPALSTMTIGQRYKVAFAYKTNDFVFYLNGVQQGTDTS
jgi:hypothetical protein